MPQNSDAPVLPMAGPTVPASAQRNQLMLRDLNNIHLTQQAHMQRAEERRRCKGKGKGRNDGSSRGGIPNCQSTTHLWRNCPPKGKFKGSGPPSSQSSRPSYVTGHEIFMINAEDTPPTTTDDQPQPATPLTQQLIDGQRADLLRRLRELDAHQSLLTPTQPMEAPQAPPAFQTYRSLEYVLLTQLLDFGNSAGQTWQQPWSLRSEEHLRKRLAAGCPPLRSCSPHQPSPPQKHLGTRMSLSR